MTTIPLLLVILLQGDYTRTIERTFSIDASQSLEIAHAMGDVTITAGDQPQVQVIAEIEAKGEHAREFGERIELIVNDEPHRLSIHTRYPDGSSRAISYSVRMRVSMPAAHALELASSFGHAAISGPRHGVQAAVSNGGLRVRDVGGQIDLTNAFGELDVAGCKGSVQVTSNSGSVQVRGVRDGGVHLRSGFGNTSITDVAGKVDAMVSNGDVVIEDVGGDLDVTTQFGKASYQRIDGALRATGNNGDVSATQITGTARITAAFGKLVLDHVGRDAQVENHNGDVTASNIAGTLRVKGSFGALSLDGVRGDCQVESTNGDVSIRDVGGNTTVRHGFGLVRVVRVDRDLAVDVHNGSIQADGVNYGSSRPDRGNRIDLAAEFGNIDVALPEPAAFRIDASTRIGTIDSSFELPNLERSLAGDTCRATLGEPVAAIKLTTHNGGIRIRKGPRTDVAAEALR